VLGDSDLNHNDGMMSYSGQHPAVLNNTSIEKHVWHIGRLQTDQCAKMIDTQTISCEAEPTSRCLGGSSKQLARDTQMIKPEEPPAHSAIISTEGHPLHVTSDHMCKGVWL
jgi:hypothetical protein